MARKILMIILIFSLTLCSNYSIPPKASAMPVLKEPVKWFVKKEIKKKTKSAIESQLIKSGVQTAEKKALEKANERWFQRLAQEEVTSLTTAVERAVPSGTPGWLKTVVGAGMFVTGADLAYDIYDYLIADNETSYYGGEGASALKGSIGINSPRTVTWGYWILGFEPDANLANNPNSWADGYPILKNTNTGEIKYFYTYVGGGQWNKVFTHHVDMDYASIGFNPVNTTTYEITFNSIYRHLWGPEVEEFPAMYDYKYSNSGKDYSISFGYNADGTLPSQYLDYATLYMDSTGKTDFDPSAKTAPQTIPMPAEYADLYPGETEAIEIIFPDPDFFPDTTQTIIDNPQIVTNPIPETQPTPQPTVGPSPSIEPTASPAPSSSAEPTGQPSPSAEPTPSPSSAPTPSVVPSSQPTTPPVIGGENPNPTTPPGEEDDDDYDGPVIDSPLTPEEALANGWEDVTPPLIKEYKDPKTGTVVKFNTKTWEITYNKYFGVDIVNAGGKKLGEIDEIDMENEIFYEDKSAKGLYIIPPGKDKPIQTPQEWADHQIRDKTAVRINSALKDGVATMPTPEGSKIVPDIESFRNFREFIFRMNADTVELREATENALNDLRQAFPDYKFSATFGGGD